MKRLLEAGRHLRKAWILLFACVVFGCGYFAAIQLTGNFSAVTPGELYRSAQLTPADIDAHVQKYGIRTIINLRGENKGQPWYEAEVKESDRLKVGHLDYGMSARHALSQAQATALIAMMEKAEKPVLIHCKDGADRTGLASALYLAVVKKEDPKVAEAQLSLRYGHISLPFIPEYAMDRSFEALEPTLRTSWGSAPAAGRAPD
jgi:protein tyrosine/serine phosphatase